MRLKLIPAPSLLSHKTHLCYGCYFWERPNDIIQTTCTAYKKIHTHLDCHANGGCILVEHDMSLNTNTVVL